jgi:hypothetical protein
MICTNGCGNYCTCPEDPNQNRIAILIAAIVIVVIYFLAGCMPIKYTELQANVGSSKKDAKINELSIKFRDYREETIVLLRQHQFKDRDCILNKIIPTVELMLIFPEDNDKQYNAWCIPSQLVYDQHHLPIMMVNINRKWDRRDAIRVIIHEALHLTSEDGKFLCGSDLFKSKIGVCTLWRKVAYQSADIDDEIEDHLREELNK